MATATDIGGKKTSIPSFGELFLAKEEEGAFEQVFIRTAEGLSSVSLRNLGLAVLGIPEDNRGDFGQGRTITDVLRAGAEEFQRITGINFGGISRAPIGDLRSAASEAAGIAPQDFQPTVLSISEFQNLAQTTQQGGGDIVKTQSLVNPQAADFSIDGQATLTAPSIEENLLGAGATIQQTAALALPQKQALAQTGAPQALTLEQIQGAGISPDQVQAGIQIPEQLDSQALSTTPSVQFQSFNPPPAFPTKSIEVTQPTARELSPTEQKAQDLSTRVQELHTSLLGKTVFQTAQEEKFGVGLQEQAIQDLTAQLTAITNEAAAIPLQLREGAGERGVTTPLLAKQENARLRTNAIAALGVSTLLAAAQGQLANAQRLADKAVNEKFGPIEEEIRVEMANLNLILSSPQFSAEVKSQAETQLQAQRQRSAQVAEAKRVMLKVENMAIEAMSFQENFVPNAQFQTAIQAVQAMQKTDPVTAQQIAQSVGLVQSPTSKFQFISQTKQQPGGVFEPSTGKFVPQPIGAPGGPPALEGTQSEFKAAGYAARIAFANPKLLELESVISDMGTAEFALQKQLPNAQKSDIFRLYQQAADNFITAVLRPESGAAIAPSEFVVAERQYLPQPGDDPDTLEQKRLLRQLVERNLTNEAGGAFQPPPEQPTTSTTENGTQPLPVTREVLSNIVGQSIIPGQEEAVYQDLIANPGKYGLTEADLVELGLK